jgi:hypothetical protein
MKHTKKLISAITIAISVLLVDCSGSRPPGLKDQMAPSPVPKTNDSSEPEISIDPSELVDQTIQETKTENAGYDGGNGTVIDKKENGARVEILRQFDQTFLAKDYRESDERNLYSNHDRKSIVYSFKKDSDEKFVSSQLWVSMDASGKNVECWIEVTTTSNNVGWLFVGNQDPYEDGNWLSIGTITIGEKTLHLRKYTHWFSTNRGERAYDRPSLEGATVVWRAERTKENDQINLTPLEITEETFPGKYWSEHWVKVKDSYGRIGWLPGDSLSIERGGFMYLSPENIVKYAFSEE